MTYPTKSNFLSVLRPAVLLLCLAAAGRAGETSETGPLLNGTIVCLGDSITQGGQYARMLQDLLDQGLPGRGIRVLSRGISGETAAWSMKRIDEDVVAANPDWVLINFGQNDQRVVGSTADFIRDYEALIARIRSSTHARIAIVSPSCDDKGQETGRLDEFAPALRALAARLNLPYVPVTEETNRIRRAMPEGIRLSPDGIHPDRFGYWVFAQTILKSLNCPLPAGPIRERMSASRAVAPGDPVPADGTIVRLDLPVPVEFTLVNVVPPRLTVRHAAKAPTIDGRLDEWAGVSAAILSSADVVGERTTTGRSTVRAAWDANGLVLAFQITDAELFNRDEVPYVVARDCIEVCLDLRPAAERAAAPAIAFGPATSHTCQYIISPAVAPMKAARCEMGNGPAAMLTGVTVASTIIPGGYAMEMRIPKALLPGGGPVAGQELGFDWAVNDIPPSGRFHHGRQTRWTGAPNGWNHTRDFAVLVLAKE